jgi:signal transduction histidine kinase
MVHLPFDEQMMKEDTNYKDSWEAWLAGVGYINKEYTKEQKDKYFRYVFAHNDLVTIPPAAREMLMQGQKYIACLHVEKHSALYFDCWYGATYNEERIQVLKRVAKVFEQAYVRFLDLQKAEALALRAEQDVIEIKAARTRAEDALAALKATQQQLIQAEKMASLGELTAGIAHEIQNPLNFVNNFSGVNKELVFELRKEARAGNIEEVMSLADTIEQNETKISHHGQRADAIVKSMLQHSRGASGNRQPTDLNQLIEEHLRLAYHGYRAKDQAFNADIGTEYDPHVGQLNVVPQEIGRVLLNLFSNAFYAVQEKSKQLNGSYEPTVSVSTKREGNKVLITVNDNGTGMSQKVTAKIFQPFFTTKPTGEGTGLGLSLSYDIVTKGHGGNLSVTSREGEGSEFVVELPAP